MCDALSRNIPKLAAGVETLLANCPCRTRLPANDAVGLSLSVGSLGNIYGWRSTYLFYKEEKEPSGLRPAGVASVHVYVSGRFVEHFATVNRLGFGTFQLSDDASIQHVCENICIMLVWRHDLARRENDGFDQALFSRHIGRVFVIRDVIWRFALLEACDRNSTNAGMKNENTHTLLIYRLFVRSRGF
jgi:hypothetical protein